MVGDLKVRHALMKRPPVFEVDVYEEPLQRHDFRLFLSEKLEMQVEVSDGLYDEYINHWMDVGKPKMIQTFSQDIKIGNVNFGTVEFAMRRIPEYAKNNDTDVGGTL